MNGPALSALDPIRNTLLARQGYECFVCLAHETGLSRAELNSALQSGILTGFVFQNASCTSCGTRAWCVEYRDIGHGKVLL